jgi:phosphoglycolate phosphatase-like HAD superfamily hydrolase
LDTGSLFGRLSGDFNHSSGRRKVETSNTTMALKHIVFDCDGVLWHGTNEGYFTCYHQAALEVGVALDLEVVRERILQNWGQSVRLEVEGMLPDHPELVAEVSQRYERLVRSELFLSRASLVAGAFRTLEALASHYALSAITGMNADNVEAMFARFGLRRFFRHAFSTAETDDPKRQKATGYHLGQLLESEQLVPEEALCVGDAAVDVQMAWRQRVPIVVVLTGHLTAEQARGLGVGAIISSIADLPSWLGIASP